MIVSRCKKRELTMQLKDLEEFYGNCYWFKKLTGISSSSYSGWRRKGYIPMYSQLKIEGLSKGKLKADLKHSEYMADKKSSGKNKADPKEKE